MLEEKVIERASELPAAEQSLVEYLDHRKNGGQSGLAAKVKLSQGAISRMVVAKRNITVKTYDNGTVELHEHKLIATSNSV